MDITTDPVLDQIETAKYHNLHVPESTLKLYCALINPYQIFHSQVAVGVPLLSAINFSHRAPSWSKAVLTALRAVKQADK
jgi:hypothetical protein